MLQNKRNAISNIDRRPLVIQTQLADIPGIVEGDQLEFGGAWAAFCRRWKLMLIAFGVIVAVGAAYTLLKKPVYESTALVMVVSSPPASSGSDDLRVLANLMAFTKSASVESHLQLMQSPEILAAASLQLDAKERTRGFGSTIVPKWAMKVTTPVKDSEIIAVTGRSYDAKAAANLANNVATIYIESDRAFTTLATKQGKEYVFSEMESVRRQLSKAQDELADYKRKTKLIVPEGQLQAIANNIAALQMELDKAKVDAAAAGRQAVSLSQQVAAEGVEIQESKTIQMNPEYEAAMQRLGGLNARRATLMQEYTPESKEIKKIDGEIAETQRQMKAIAETIVASKVSSRNPALNTYTGSVVTSAAANAKAQALMGVLQNRSKEMEQLPEQERTMARLMQKVGVLERTHQSLNEKFYALLVNEKSIMPNARLASMAYPAPKPAVPNLPMNAAVFVLLGLMSAIGAAVIAEKLDKKVRDEAMIARLTEEPIMAVIPGMKKQNGARLQIDNPECDDAFVESFRNLRNVVSYSMDSHPMKLMAVTSPGRGEGKTTICINLAIAMALDRKKVLVVDCDLRRPSIRNRMNLSDNKAGFTNLVSGRITIDEAIIPTAVENLFCMPSGPYFPNPAEFLNSQASKDMIKELAGRFDVVILDCPPAAGLSDMQVVSRMVDGVLLVVSMDQTLRTGLYDTVRRLEQVGAPIMGTVVNRVNMTKSDYEYYHYTGVEGLETDAQPQLDKPKKKDAEKKGEKRG